MNKCHVCNKHLDICYCRQQAELRAKIQQEYNEAQDIEDILAILFCGTIAITMLGVLMWLYT